MAPLTDSDFCWAHDPGRARERAGARRRGGQKRQARPGEGSEIPAPSLRSVDAIQTLLEEAVRDTLRQENSAQRSRSLGYLAGLAMKALEVGELEERVAALEANQTPRKARA